MAPTYEKVAKNLKHIVNVGAVDCAKEADICEELDVESVPELILIPYGIENRDNIEHYTGEKTATKIYDFALTALPQTYVTTLKLNPQYSEFLLQPKPKIILFSKKPTPSPLFISLSLFFKDHVSFGFVPSSSAAGITAENQRVVSDWPSIVAFSSEGEKEVYQGEISYPALSLFINKILKTSKKRVTKEEGVVELNSKNLGAICSTGLCGILLVDPSQEKLANDQDEILKKLSVKYLHERLKFTWVGLDNSESIRESVAPEAKYVIYNPKSIKVAWTADGSFEGISAFVDRVLGGGEKWIKLDKLGLRV